MSRRALVAGLVTLTAVTTAACGTSTGDGSPSVRTRTRTVVHTRTPARPPFTPAPARTVTPLPPGAHPRAGEVEKRCPYIASTPDENARTNVADIDGSHVYRTTVLTRREPVGCRFYFYAPPYEAIADILPRRLASAARAHDAMVLTAEAGTDAEGHRDLIPGVDAVLYRTRFFGPDGARDWACAFAKGRLLVIVHTQRSDTSLNALLLARVIARRI